MTTNTSSNPILAILTSLASVGSINWGLIGAVDFNLVTYLLGEGSAMTKVTYIAVGLSGLYLLFGIITSLTTSNTTSIK
jgi:uncharacterized membrane protein YuzA (DUF378 family)